MAFVALNICGYLGIRGCKNTGSKFLLDQPSLTTFSQTHFIKFTVVLDFKRTSIHGILNKGFMGKIAAGLVNN